MNARVLLSEILPLAAAWLLAPVVPPLWCLLATAGLAAFGALRQRGRVSRAWRLMNGLAVAVTAVGVLMADQPEAARAAVQNMICAAVFLLGAGGRVPLLRELAEQRAGKALPDVPGLAAFLRGYTVIWAVFFALRSLVWSATLAYRLDDSLLHRGMMVSLTAMIALSLAGSQIFRLSRRMFRSGTRSSTDRSFRFAHPRGSCRSRR